jgi:hypothetical protein
MVLPDSDGVSRVPPYSGSTLVRVLFQLQGCYLLWRVFPNRFVYSAHPVMSVLQPQEASLLVWAVPVSLATTQGIAFAFSSSGYLDVSVPQVCLPYPMDSGKDTARSGQWVSPFGNLRIKAYLQLPEAYRCSFRPSSAPSAKASTVRSYSLNLINVLFTSLSSFQGTVMSVHTLKTKQITKSA